MIDKIHSDKPGEQTSVFVTAAEAIELFKKGEILILIDDEDRENEGDFILAAERVTPQAIDFMAKYGRGLVCLSITEERAKQLQLAPMVSNNSALLGTAFTVSVDAVEGTTTGISAFDRAVTVQKMIDPNATPEDLARPGHLFPLVANSGGVLARPGHTEAVVDIAKAAGMTPSGVLCEILDDDGTMARLPKLIKIAEEFGLKIGSVRDIVNYRLRSETLVRKITDVDLPSSHGNFHLHLYESTLDSQENHLAMVKGNVDDGEPVLIRIHSECLTGDILGSMRCDCGDQLHIAMHRIEETGRGAVLYLRQEGRGIGLANKILAYKLQDDGKDTVEANEALGFKADLREYWFAAQMLKDLGIRKVRLMTNNPRKIEELTRHNIEVVERVPILVDANPANERYLLTKEKKLGHILATSENGKSKCAE